MGDTLSRNHLPRTDWVVNQCHRRFSKITAATEFLDGLITKESIRCTLVFLHIAEAEPIPPDLFGNDFEVAQLDSCEFVSFWTPPAILETGLVITSNHTSEHRESIINLLENVRKLENSFVRDLYEQAESEAQSLAASRPDGRAETQNEHQELKEATNYYEAFVRGEDEKALDGFLSMKSKYPLTPYYRSLLSEIYLRNRRYPDALRELLFAQSLDPDYLPVTAGLIYCLVTMGLHPVALDLCQHFDNLNEENSGSTAFARGYFVKPIALLGSLGMLNLMLDTSEDTVLLAERETLLQSISSSREPWISGPVIKAPSNSPSKADEIRQRTSIFLSYRRSDTLQEAIRLEQSLQDPQGSVFRDHRGIEVADEFPAILKSALDGARAVIVLIGREWLDCTDAAGNRRLEDEFDFVRRELVYALQHKKEKKIDIVPVLVNDAKMPKTNELPAGLEELGTIQAHEIGADTFDKDVEALQVELKRLEEARSRAEFSAWERATENLRKSGKTFEEVCSFRPSGAANPDLHDFPELADWECKGSNQIALRFRTEESGFFGGFQLEPEEVRIEGTWRIRYGPDHNLVMSLSGRSEHGEKFHFAIPIQEKIGTRTYCGHDKHGTFVRIEYSNPRQFPKRKL